MPIRADLRIKAGPVLVLALHLSHTLPTQGPCGLLSLGTKCLLPKSRATCVCFLDSTRTRSALFFISFSLSSPIPPFHLFFLSPRQSVLLTLKSIDELYYWGPHLTTKTIQIAWISLLHVSLYVHFFPMVTNLILDFKHCRLC